MSTTHIFDTYNDRHDTLTLNRRISGQTLHEPNLFSEQRRPSDINDPKELKYLAKNPEWIDCPFCHERALSRVETKSNVGAAVVSTAMSAVSVLVGAGPPWGGMRCFTHYSSSPEC
ncbi:uncharacterized protein P174DRAFT_418371 [Aspergillus novofumigatus IBT 16806]|uniref:LITAF domain-containing protein n=1 Tax=Aspergillus novofumigatus (strain IBT 16806) TaxID=1392255 RepID=A0A2I1CIE5_ASPN1|nr:uncharacterized protein P174DRAFT_418371 [Aspergillus novofumigatus IBT 16806]PKX97398.1 hypothetical protein P174DRAFT_418371 [Aspergillus novofumigatus IBT 16806]